MRFLIEVLMWAAIAAMLSWNSAHASSVQCFTTDPVQCEQPADCCVTVPAILPTPRLEPFKSFDDPARVKQREADLRSAEVQKQKEDAQAAADRVQTLNECAVYEDGEWAADTVRGRILDVLWWRQRWAGTYMGQYCVKAGFEP